MGQGSGQCPPALPFPGLQDSTVGTLPRFVKILGLDPPVLAVKPGQVIGQGLNLHPPGQHDGVSSPVCDLLRNRVYWLWGWSA